MVTPAASVIVPAHNEGRTLGRLLDALTAPSAGAPLEIIVAANGCTDDTVSVATRPGVTVLDLPTPSKRDAMAAADRLASTFPRVFLDADVEITGTELRRLADAVRDGRYLAAGPTRELPMDRVGLLVRWYYQLWQELPHVRSGLFGRGVIAVSEQGHARLRSLPSVMADDLAIAEAFRPDERVVLAGARVTIHPPRTMGDLLRRRRRVVTGNSQADGAGLRSASARTGPATLLGILRRRPQLLPQALVFATVTVLARAGARRAVRAGDFTTWQRDESSRG